jgi:uracil-DNA glycosylase family 4
VIERKHPLAECEVCPLAKGGRFVPSVGNNEAKVAFVGEAPGVQEARNGRPFVGPSGKLLNLVLRHHGIRRSDLMLTNACLCRPADGSTPPKAAIAACRPRLVGELDAIGVGTVVALGNSASEALLGISGVSKLRVGPGRPSKYLPDVHVISTFHPAACLRQGDMFPFLVADVGKIGVSREPWVPPRYWVAEDPLEALHAIQFLRDGTGTGTLVVDIEVDVEKDTAFDHPNRYGMLCVGVAYARKRCIVFAGSSLDAQVWRELGVLFRERPITAQNGKFDLAGVYPHMGDIELDFDTMLASYACDERPGIHGLKHQAVEYLGAPQYDDDIKQYISGGRSYGNIPKPLLYRYNAYDVACTWELQEYYEQKFNTPSSEGLRAVHDHLVRASNQLKFVELNGIAIDREYLKTLSGEYLQRIADIRTLICQVYGEEINPNSPLQIKKALLKYRVRVDSTDVNNLNTILEMIGDDQKYNELREFVSLLLKHRREAKLYGTYLKGTTRRLYRGRVYPTFLLHGTTSGRLACRNPNLQNVPRESSIRRLYVPAVVGNVFVQVDYSQAELRVLSFLARDRYFRDIFNGGDRDLFDELTPILYPSASKAALGPVAWKELRIRVKAYVYGLAYGRTEYSIADEFGISVAQARSDMARFFAVIPEIVAFQEQTRQSVLAGNYLETPFGRRRRFGLITDENKKDIMNEALAFKPQSTASDMCLQAFTEVRKELRGKAFIRNIVHDSILAECKATDAEEVAAVINKHMVDSATSIVGDYVKFATDYKVGLNWGEV